MSFSDEVKKMALVRAHGRCECTHVDCRHHHSTRCNAILTESNWRAHHIIYAENGGTDTLRNCEAVCTACHEQRHRFDPAA